MEKDFSDWHKAGNIARKALMHGKKLAKSGISLLDLADAIEQKILDLGAKPGFPVNLSLNSIAAHYTPTIIDKTIFTGDDILKIDVGVQFNGAVGDNAFTVGNHKELIQASRDALEAATKLVAPGTQLRQIGKAIQEAIESHGFTPITNLSGHGISRYIIHDAPTIPNYDNGNATELKNGMTIAIEPFATTGQGLTTEGAPSNIYRFVAKKPIRDMNARKILDFIEKNYRTLPFAKRWIERQFPHCGVPFSALVKAGILYSYAQLPEKSGGLVSQAENSFLVGEKLTILTADNEE